MRGTAGARPELILVSVAGSDYEYIYFSLDGTRVHRKVNPWVGRGTVRVKCLTQEHNTVSPARARTRTPRSGLERHALIIANTDEILVSSFSQVFLRFSGSQFNPLMLYARFRDSMISKIHVVQNPELRWHITLPRYRVERKDHDAVIRYLESSVIL